MCLTLSPYHLPWNNFCLEDPKVEIVWLGAPCIGNNGHSFSDVWTSSNVVVNRQRTDRFNEGKLHWYELRKQFLLPGHFLRQMWTRRGHLLPNFVALPSAIILRRRHVCGSWTACTIMTEAILSRNYEHTSSKIPEELTHWGRVTQICVFTLKLRKTDDANMRF